MNAFFEIYSMAQQSKIEIIEQRVDTPVVRHAHHYLELAYIKQGWSKHTRNNISQKLTAGNYIILDYGETHSYDIVSDDLVVINCLFKPEVIDIALKGCQSFQEMLSNYMINIGYMTAPATDHLFSDKQNKILALLTKMMEEYCHVDTGYLQIIRCALIEIIIETMRTVQDSSLVGMRNYDPEISEIILKINQNPNEAVCLSDFAKKYSVSVGNLSRKFKATTGYHFSEFLQRKKMEQACRMLSNTNCNIDAIAEKSGYNDVKFFHTVFKRIIGQTPAQYRKKFR